MTKEKIKVNLVELCLDLAAIPFSAVEKEMGVELEIWNGEDEIFEYTEEGQEIFDKYYDEIWNYLVSQGFENRD